VFGGVIVPFVHADDKIGCITSQNNFASDISAIMMNTSQNCLKTFVQKIKNKQKQEKV
jgi:hypothetical protein